MSSPKLVLVSNRIPITFTTEEGKLKGVPSSGGLVSALEPLLKDHGGIWVGSGGNGRFSGNSQHPGKGEWEKSLQIRATLPDRGGAKQLLRGVL